MQLGDEVHLERAADTPVLKGDERVVLLAHHPALLNKGCIDIHFTDIVDDHRKANALGVRQDTVEKCGLATTEITGNEQDRYFWNFFHFLSHLENLFKHSL